MDRMPAPRRTHEATDRTIGAQADLHEYASKIHTLKFATGQSLDRLLEEPIANLDPAHQHDALRIAREIASQCAGVFLILHDLNLAAQYADRTILLKDGRIAAAGTPAEVIRRIEFARSSACAPESSTTPYAERRRFFSNLQASQGESKAEGSLLPEMLTRGAAGRVRSIFAFPPDIAVPRQSSGLRTPEVPRRSVAMPSLFDPRRYLRCGPSATPA